MHRTRLVAMAVLIPVVAAVVAAAAVIVTALIGTSAFSVTQTSASPLPGGFRQDGGNRGW